jgi:23S rRNA (guanosine2251-2'-O)-methyltransferase
VRSETHRSPRDAFVTVFGRKPVMEALDDPSLDVDKVVLAANARDRSADEILRKAAERGVPVRREPPAFVTRLSGSGRHDQGVVADVRAPRMAALEGFLADLPPGSGDPVGVLVLDGVTTPANVGMVLRTATAAGMDGIVLPRRGTASVGPLVIKASAGVAFRAPILNCATAELALEALGEAGFTIFGLEAGAGQTVFDAAYPPRCAFVIGGETAGVSPEARPWVHDWVSIPMAAEVESLNAAAAATVVAFELARRRRAVSRA